MVPGSFMSLEEFLALPDDKGKPMLEAFSGAKWLEMYEMARQSWLAYGENPPIGAKLEIIHGGLCGHLHAHEHKILVGPAGWNENYFTLKSAVRESPAAQYSVIRSQWWRYFRVIELPAPADTAAV